MALSSGPPASGPHPGGATPRYGVVSGALLDPDERERLGFEPTGAGPVVVELNLLHPSGLAGARAELEALWARSIPDAPSAETVTDTYVRATLTIEQIQALVAADLGAADGGPRLIHRIWPDYRVRPLIDRSASTIKADAARRVFTANGTGICWAVIDSGVDARHPHFAQHGTFDPRMARQHRDFTRPGTASRSALTDGFGHGTHVAGIIAGGLPAGFPSTDLVVAGELRNPDPAGSPLVVRRQVSDTSELSGMAPMARLVSLKVLDDNGDSLATDVIRALAYVRTQLNNANSDVVRVHGVNLSLGYEFDPSWDACGHSPICEEVNRLVHSGVVVVVAAGNTGYGLVPGPAAQHQPRPGHDDQRPGQRRAGDHGRVDAPGQAAHLRGVVLLVEGPDG